MKCGCQLKYLKGIFVCVCVCGGGGELANKQELKPAAVFMIYM